MPVEQLIAKYAKTLEHGGAYRPGATLGLEDRNYCRTSHSLAPQEHFLELFGSMRVAQGKTWDQIAAFVGHLDQRTTQRYIHFMPRDKRETANSLPFEF